MALRAKRQNQSRDKKRPIEHNGLYPYFARFIDWGQVIEQVSPDTTRRRDSALRRFIAWCDDRGVHQPQEITLPLLERYQRHLFYYRKADGDPLSATSQAAMLASIKTFFKWLTREGYLHSNPASEMQLPRTGKKLPAVILRQAEVQALLNQPDLNTPEGVRDRAILETLYATGMRRMELCNLTIYDIDPRRESVLIKAGKGNKDRLIPLGERALAWIEKYLHEVRQQFVTVHHKQRLFLTDYGEPFTRGGLGAHVRKYLDRAGIEKQGSCHLLRHACATHMLENGADIRFIQALLGHDDLNSTQIYTHVSIEKLKEVHAATHPAKLKTTRTENNEEQLALMATLDWEAELDDEEAEITRH